MSMGSKVRRLKTRAIQDGMHQAQVIEAPLAEALLTKLKLPEFTLNASEVGLA